jgi:amidase
MDTSLRMENIVFKSSVEILSLIHSGKISSKSVLLAFLEQIDKYQAKINAITDLKDRDELIREAEEKDNMLNNGELIGPLHGLPMTVKDAFNVKGLISSMGVPSLQKNVAKEDAVLVKKLKNAGAIIIGKTNLPLFSIDWQTTNTWFGQTNNPYNTEYVAGGSSGGSAAALAMGFTPLELGSDAGGSIRVPAHFCGVCGIRPTEQTLSNRGQFLAPGKPQGQRQITVAGPMARTVDDLTLAMSVLTHQPEISEIYPVDFNRSSWDKSPLKIAYSKTMYGLEIQEDYQELITSFLNKIELAGHSLHVDQPEYDADLAYRINGRFMGFEIASGSPMPIFITKIFMFLFLFIKYRDIHWARSTYRGISMTPNMHLKTVEAKEKIGDQFIEFFNEYDLWITPVASITAFKHQRAGKPFLVNGQRVPYTDALGRFNFDTSVGGHPVVVIPIGVSKNGLPAGISLHGRKWEDKKLLEIAKEFQEQFTDGFIIPSL